MAQKVLEKGIIYNPKSCYFLAWGQMVDPFQQLALRFCNLLCSWRCAFSPLEASRLS
jgi:hypothetical protein